MLNEGTQDIFRFMQQENIRLRHEVAQLQHENAQMRRVLRALRTLQEVSIGVNVKTDVFFLMNRILESALASVNARDGSLLLIDEDTAELVFVVAKGEIGEDLLGYRLKMGEGIAGWVAQNRKPVLLADVRRDHRFSTAVDETFSFHTQSMLAVPVMVGNEVLGVIQALNKENGEQFNEADLTLFSVVALLAATALTNMDQALAMA
jgi:GAF domain-containing protein